MAITVVIDGSTDATVERAREYARDIDIIVFEKNRGCGAAIMEAWSRSDAELLSFLDADGTCEPRFFADLCRNLMEQEADVILGCRLNANSQMSKVRRLGNTCAIWRGAMGEALCDLSNEYEAMLNQGISLSGENLHYFVAGRVRAMRVSLPDGFAPRTILDFGCGVGHATAALAELYPNAQVTGMDTALPALARAQTQHPGCRFVSLEELRADDERYDLCYVNGVFHHIPLAERAEAMRLIASKLRPGGYLYLFENNPWNPGARWEMSRIPFDRDAVMLSIPETARLEAAAGLVEYRRSSLFFFPRTLGFMRPLEPVLAPTLLGAQYFVAARKP